jgi:thymidylate synthase
VKEYEDVESAFIDALSVAWRTGVSVAPRGAETRETVGMSLRIKNPRARLITHPARRWSLALAVGELCWHLRGASDVGSLAYYSRAWADASADGKSISGSCYGRRIFGEVAGGVSQWVAVREILRRDPDSRRATLLFGPPVNVFERDAPDFPCATAAQFIARGGKLNLLVFMRSNDLIWGFGYDCFLFTMLQERMALELGLDLGWYQHVVGSLHLYSRHFELAQRIQEQSHRSGQRFMPPMGDLDSIDDFVNYEETLRRAENISKPPTLPQYWRQLAFVLFHFRLSKEKRSETCDRALEQVLHEIQTPYSQLLAR